jgi:hypothetical protein
MHVYIVFVDGVELPRSQWVKARSHNEAERKACKQHNCDHRGFDAKGRHVSVVYTEV